MTKTLDDIKREAVSAFLVEERHNDTQEDRIRRVTIQDTIDYLQAQGLLMVWQPIETYDYEKFPLVMLAGFITPSEYAQSNGSKPFWEISIGRCWHVNTRKFTGFLGQQPTHWMPLPAAPKGDK